VTKAMYGFLVGFLILVVARGLYIGMVMDKVTQSQDERRAHIARISAPVGMLIRDLKPALDDNGGDCGFTPSQGFDYDEVTDGRVESTAGTPFAGIWSSMTVPTAWRRKQHSAADYLWCNVVLPGETRKVRVFFVSGGTIVNEFLYDMSGAP